MKQTILQPVYCEYMPEEMEDGKLYISERFQLAIHLCACGCGQKTVTPTGKGAWALTKSADKVTLRPSVGNFKWENPYHAHYYITDNMVQWL